MKAGKYYSLTEVAKILGISRIAVYKKAKKGQIKAVRIGRNFAIPQSELVNIKGEALKQEDKNEIEKAVKKTVEEYGQVLKLLGRE